MSDPCDKKLSPCQFRSRWGGVCGILGQYGWCPEHIDLRCVRCGKKAIRECEFSDAGNGSVSNNFNCYAPLCDDCEHEPYIPGKIMFPDHDHHLTKAEIWELKKNAPPLKNAWENDSDNPDDDFLKTGS